MDAQVYKCPGCGQAIQFQNVDFKTRRAHCDWCENDVVLPRSEINTSDKVINDLKNAVRFFKDKNFDSAHRFAESILSTAVDNAVGLFILGYCKAFVATIKNRDFLEKFFFETLGTLEFDEEELSAFKEVLLTVIPHVIDYEEPILSALLAQDPEGIVEFTEAFSPFAIMRRVNISWVNDNIFGLYKEITSRGDIQKTWYALYTAMVKNPDSPYQGGFFLKTKTARFYNDFVMRVEDVFQGIQDEKLRAKFLGAFLNKKQEFITKMNEGGN